MVMDNGHGGGAPWTMVLVWVPCLGPNHSMTYAHGVMTNIILSMNFIMISMIMHIGENLKRSMKNHSRLSLLLLIRM